MSDKILHPIVIHKGKKKSSQIRRLKKGRGKLAEKVSETLSRVRAKIADSNKILVPIVVHYTLKAEKKSVPAGLFN